MSSSPTRWPRSSRRRRRRATWAWTRSPTRTTPGGASAPGGRAAMQAFVGSEPHRGITTRLDHYCDEATFVDWEQDSPDLPDWKTSWRHITADGQVAELTQ